MDLLILLGVTLAKIVFFTFLLVLTLVAYSVYAERRFSAILQDRVGPNRTGIPLTILGFEKDLQLPIGAAIGRRLKVYLKRRLCPWSRPQGFFLARSSAHDGSCSGYRRRNPLRQRSTLR